MLMTLAKSILFNCQSMQCDKLKFQKNYCFWHAHTANICVTQKPNFTTTGKRDCLGKSLALTELYLFFAALMQRYTFRWINEANLDQLSIEGKVGFARSPMPYDVIISKRVQWCHHNIAIPIKQNILWDLVITKHSFWCYNSKVFSETSLQQANPMRFYLIAKLFSVTPF